jgi:hypothetical protein
MPAISESTTFEEFTAAAIRIGSPLEDRVLEDEAPSSDGSSQDEAPSPDARLADPSWSHTDFDDHVDSPR